MVIVAREQKVLHHEHKDLQHDLSPGQRVMFYWLYCGKQEFKSVIFILFVDALK